MSRAEIIKAYRSLYRSGLHAVQYSKPARYLLRDKLREAFRSDVLAPSASIVVASASSKSTSSWDFDPERVRRTVWFLNAAAESRGIEHKIVKNLLFIQWHRRRGSFEYWKQTLAKPPVVKRREDADLAKHESYKQFDATVAMLNESMGLCLQ